MTPRSRRASSSRPLSIRRLPVRLALATALGAGAAALSCGCALDFGSAPSGLPSVSAANSLTTVRPDQPTPDTVSRGASLMAAGNEFESFQILVDAGSALRNVSIGSAGPLHGPRGAAIPVADLRFYREASYRVGTPHKPLSDSEGRPGLWPDALIPARDSFYGERRDAFPAGVRAGSRLVAWVDVFVPPHQRPGRYSGSVTVRDSRGTIGRLPVKLRVLPFSLPSTSSLPSAYGFDWPKVCEAFTGSGDCDGDQRQAARLSALFARAALDDRITLSVPFPSDSNRPPRSQAQLRLFERYVSPLLAGTDPHLRLRGARLNSFQVSWYCLVDPDCLGAWKALAERDGFADRLALYLCDEPGADASAWRQCGTRAAQAERQQAGIPALVTATIQNASKFAGPALLARIGILALVVNQVDGIEGTDYSGNQRPQYDRFLAETSASGARRLWLYTSCLSYGCEGASEPPSLETGWPGYAIDEPPSQQRAIGWLAFDYGAVGELYYQVTQRLPSAWIDQYDFGGNGDGTLFYPGLPRGGGGAPAIGGRHPIPIESIRLKRIRDGREDYEYLRLLAERGQRAAALRVIGGLFGPRSVALHSATVSPGQLERARRRLAALIDAS